MQAHPPGRRGSDSSLPRRLGPRSLVSTVGGAVASTVGLACAVSLLTGCQSNQSAPSAESTSSVDDSYGALPTFLPSATVQPNSTLTGNAARPALTVEGDAIRAVLDDGAQVSVTVSGPVVPGQGLPHASPAPTCTWTVTMRSATGPVPIDVTKFNTLDHLGHTYRVAFVPGQPTPPTVLQPGQSTTFELRAVMPTGEGLMRWAPDGQHIIASWDFEVEND